MALIMYPFQKLKNYINLEELFKLKSLMSQDQIKLERIAKVINCFKMAIYIQHYF